MAALVQTIPQQASTITLLQRPASSSSSFSSTPHASSLHNTQMARNQQSSNRQTYASAVANSGSYRSSTAQPVAPYAFTSTPSLANRQSSPAPYLKLDDRTVSAPSVPQGHTNHGAVSSVRNSTHYSAAGSVSSSSSSSFLGRGSKDDSAIPTGQQAAVNPGRPTSMVGFTPPSLSNASSSNNAKPSPDRYRRGQRRSDQTSQTPNPASMLSNVQSSSLYGSMTSGADRAPSAILDSNISSDLSLAGITSHHARGSSADNVQLPEKTQSPELAKRYRRRSLGSLDTTGALNFAGPTRGSNGAFASPTTLDLSLAEDYAKRPVGHGRAGSSDSNSSHSSSASAKRDVSTSNKQSQKSATPLTQPNIPKRSTTPSPLSRPLVLDADTPSLKTAAPNKTTSPAQPKPQSPAAKQLSELNKKNQKAGKSRLRRALSFGSAADLRGASQPENAAQENAPEKPLTRKQQLDMELGAEQAAIAEKQEAAGLGENIYSSHIFSSSTDNLSISSTASSASIMLRKMGKGVRKSTRSLVGLFRPKSIHSAAPDEPSKSVEPMIPQVSMVTVEAERDLMARDPSAPGSRGSGVARDYGLPETGSTSERNGIDSMRGRKSIIGGDMERAEVLAAVRKGILKRAGSSNTPSPTIRPTDYIPRPSDSPHSSAPSTPRDDHPARSGHRRTDSVTIEGEDYFLPPGRFSGSDTVSAPVTPQTSAAAAAAAAAAKNISFSPRIQFHDTWPSGEYDRRGEIATCNRLTPLLAQQIKEELNTFKMEMEVHESSKIYTQFF